MRCGSEPTIIYCYYAFEIRDCVGRIPWEGTAGPLNVFFFTTSAHPRPRFDSEVTTDRVSPRDLLLCSYLIRHIRGTPVLFAHIEDRDGKK